MKNLAPVQASFKKQTLFFFITFLVINLIYMLGALIDKGLGDRFSYFVGSFYFSFLGLQLIIVLVLITFALTIGIFRKLYWALGLYLVVYLINVFLVIGWLFNDSEGAFAFMLALPASFLGLFIGILIGRLYFNTASKLFKGLILLVLLIALISLMLNYTILY